jgi:pSer/pThr/pTyr-binding forkhead associated (FHA) protein
MPQLTVLLKDREIGRHALGHQARIGRDPGMDIVIDNVGVSRHHATLQFDGVRYRLTDAGSQNGVFVNGQRIQQRELADGDEIHIGKFKLDFTMAGPMSTAPPPANDTAISSRRQQDAFKTFALRRRPEITGAPRASMRPASKARGAEHTEVCERRVTQRAGMQRRPNAQ